jgi:hypothetical protein
MKIQSAAATSAASPWLDTLKTMKEDGRVTKAEVKKYVAAYRDLFCDVPATLESLGKLIEAPPSKRETWVTAGARKEIATALETRCDRPLLPTKEQLTRIYGQIANRAIADGTAVILDGPPVADPNAYPSFDITPEGLMDVNMAVYLIDGDLYHRQSGFSFGPEGMISVWRKIGPAPHF